MLRIILAVAAPLAVQSTDPDPFTALACGSWMVPAERVLEPHLIAGSSDGKGGKLLDLAGLAGLPGEVLRATYETHRDNSAGYLTTETVLRTPYPTVREAVLHVHGAEKCTLDKVGSCMITYPDLNIVRIAELKANADGTVTLRCGHRQSVGF